MTLTEKIVQYQEGTVERAIKSRDIAKAKICESKKSIFDFAKNVHDIKNGDMDTLFELLDNRIDDYANAVKWLANEERTLERYKEQLAKE